MLSLGHGSPAFFRVAIRQKRHWVWFGDPGLPPRVLRPSVTPRGGEEGDDEEARGTALAPPGPSQLWGVGRHGRGQDPQVPHARKLSVTQAFGPRDALSRPLDTGSSCLAMSLLQGAPFQEPWGLAIGQHNNHSGSCGLSAPLGQQGRTPRGLRGVCFPVRAPSRLLCPGCTTREEGPHSRSPLETTRWGGNLAF